MQLKKLAGDSLIFGFSKYASLLSAVILTPIYTRILTKAEYGTMDVFNTWNLFAAMLLPLGLVTSVLRFYPDFAKDPIEKRNTLGSIFTFLLILCAVYALLMFLFQNTFQYIFIGNTERSEIYFHCIFIVIMGIFLSYCQTILQSKLLKYKYLVVSLINLVFLNTLGFIFVYYYDMRIEGFFRASSIALLFSVSSGMFFVRKEIFLLINKNTLKKLLSYSIHLISVFFLFQATNLLDRFLLKEFDSLDGVGIYSIGAKIASLIQIVISSFAIAWFPRAMSIKNDEDASQTYRKVHDFYYLIAFLILSSVLLFRKELILFFAPDYESSYQIIGILCLFNVINGLNYVYALGLHIKNKTKYLSLAAFLSITVNIICSVTLISLIGIDGVAWGTLVGGIVWIGVQFFISQKFYPVKFNYGLAVLIAGLSIFLLNFTTYIDYLLNFSLIINILIKLLLTALLAITTFILLKKNKLIKSFIS